MKRVCIAVVCLVLGACADSASDKWSKPGVKDGVGGVLYLTDQRLVFEQKEELDPVAAGPALIEAAAADWLPDNWPLPIPKRNTYLR